MGRNVTSHFKRDRIDPRAKKPNKMHPPKRGAHKDDVEDEQPKTKKHAKDEAEDEEEEEEEEAEVEDEEEGMDGEEAEEDEDGFQTVQGDDGEAAAMEEGAEGGEDEEGIPFSMGITQDEVQEEKRKGSGLRSAKEIYALPTREELAELKETQNLFKSNLFRMQMDEMLKQITVNYDKETFLESALHELKGVLDAMKPGKEREVSAETDFGSGVKAPIIIGRDISSHKFAFKTPASVTIVGSYLLRGVTKPELNVDVAVEMPGECFQPKDFMNHRYLHKRGFYLATIAAALKKSPKFKSLSFEAVDGNPLRPVLVLKPVDPAGAEKTRFYIRIHPCIAEDVFKVQKLAPNRNSMRRHKGETLLPEGADEAADPDVESATPRYNQCVLRDMFFADHLKLLHKYFADPACKGIVDAALLLKTWLRQREMGYGAFGTMNGFVACMLVIHLVQTRQVPKESSSYQIFRSVMHFLGTTDLDQTGVAMKLEDGREEQERPTLADFNAAFDVVFVDPSGHVNLLAGMTKGHYANLKHEARLAFRLLEDSSVDGFTPLFMKPLVFHEKYDQVVSVSVTPAIGKRYPAQLLDRGGDWCAFAESLLVAVLTRGLGDRIHIATPLPRKIAGWKVDEVPAQPEQQNIACGLLLNTYNAERIIDMGPPADAPEAAAFKNFWGEKSELRRFPDGSLNEAVVWDCAPSQTHGIVRRIILHLLSRHGRVAGKDVVMETHPFEDVLCDGEDEHDHGSEFSRKAIVIYEELAKQLRDMQLPLSIIGVNGISPTLHYTEVFPPPSADTQRAKPAQTHPYKPALEVLIQLESSGKWPDDFTAIQHVKAAFYIKIASICQESLKAETNVTAQFVDVFYKSYVFRLVIFVERELHLLRQRTDNLAAAAKALAAAGTMAKEAEEAASRSKRLLGEVEKSFVVLPLWASTCHSLALEFPAFRGAVRLAKRWLHAHMFSAYFEEEAVEALVASLFSASGQYIPPGSAHVGFIRFLRLLAEHDFENDPIIVDVENMFGLADLTEIAEYFREHRASLPPVFIATPQDKKASVWTKSGPKAPMLLRMKIFAKNSLRVALDLVQLDTHTNADPDFGVIFRTPLDEYDIVIELKERAHARATQRIGYVKKDDKDDAKKRKYKNLEDDDETAAQKPSDALVEFDPVTQYFNELQAAYGHLGLFFYDKLGGAYIAVALNPSERAPKPFKIDTSPDTMPHPDAKALKKGKKGEGAKEFLVSLNIDAIVANMQILGEGLVKSIRRKD